MRMHDSKPFFIDEIARFRRPMRKKDGSAYRIEASAHAGKQLLQTSHNKDSCRFSAFGVVQLPSLAPAITVF
jgi:hypothetical protein